LQALTKIYPIMNPTPAESPEYTPVHVEKTCMLPLPAITTLAVVIMFAGFGMYGKKI